MKTVKFNGLVGKLAMLELAVAFTGLVTVAVVAL